MKIQNVATNLPFYSENNLKSFPRRHEFIDTISESVRNQQDVQDMVAVPRGIFKAYIYLMAGSSLMLIAAALPNKLKSIKSTLNIGSAVLSGISAVYFAKPFAVKGLSPTVTREEVKELNDK